VEHVDELIAAHALHALGPEDEAVVERHLTECDRCRAELREYERVAGALAYAAPPALAPPELRTRILDALPAPEMRADAPAESGGERRWWWWPRLSGFAVPALAAAAIALLVWNVSLRNDLNDLHGALASAPTLHMQGVGNVVSDPGGQLTLYGDLAPAPAGKVYEAWVIASGKPLPAGIFEGGGNFQLELSQEAHPGDVIAITVEPAEGEHETPTGAPIAKATVSNA
jgi:anti-sigma-K factor RskA